ncbi:alpha/beta hydrolase [Solibacillus sp. CAU 1738]|uniref:alpha/beta fold hydrolase n=1 Tax=Solibacillus sp. CAU 1738 TaxID=3140363 RepID=UPI0032608C5D
MHFEEYGDTSAPLLMFLHGGGVSGWMWDKQVQHFTNYHCIVPDLPEQGKSGNTENFSIKRSAEMLLALIEAKAQNKQVIVIGFSLGAQIAVQMVSMKSHMIDYAIVNSALVRPMPFSKSFISLSVKCTYPLINIKSFSKLQAKTLYVDQDYFEQYYRDSAAMKCETLVRILQENMAFHIPEQFHKAESKILITVGEKEKGIMKKSAADLVNNNPNCKGVILPNIGHGVSLAKPDFFNRMVEGWIKEEKLPEGKVIS